MRWVVLSGKRLGVCVSTALCTASMLVGRCGCCGLTGVGVVVVFGGSNAFTVSYWCQHLLTTQKHVLFRQPSLVKGVVWVALGVSNTI